VRVWLQSLQSADMTPKIFFLYISNMAIKNAKFDAIFKSTEKVAKKFTRRKLEG
jgi:hypothetical protein